MKKKILYAASFLALIATVAYAAGFNRIASPELRLGKGTSQNLKYSFDQGSSNLPYIQWNASTSQIVFSNDGTTSLPIGSGAGGGGVNILANPDFEQGIGTGYTSSGGTFTADTSTMLFGTTSGVWNPSATSQTLTTTDQVVPEGLEGRPCVASIYYKWDSGTATHINLRAELSDGTDLTAPVDLNVTNGSAVNAFVSFLCPSSASIHLTLTSTADAAAITLDKFHLGSNINDIISQDPVEVVASAHFAAAVNCSWSRTSTTLGAFSTDSDCPAITVDVSSPIVSITTTNTNLPQIVFATLPAGVYEIKAIFSGRPGTATNIATYGLTDGTTTYDTHSIDGDATNSIIVLMGTFSHAGGAKTFSIQSQSSANTAVLDNSSATGQTPNLTFQVTRFPTSSTSKVTLETQGWHIDSTITGANPSLGTASVTSYTEIIDAGLTLTNQTGSATAQIPCSTTNPPTGTTCSAGSESVGVAFTPPYAGLYYACATFNHEAQLNSTVRLTDVFTIQETSVSAQTIQTSGTEHARHSFIGAAASQNYAVTEHVCGFFNFASASQHVLRVMYQQNDVSGTPNSSTILADNAVSGEGNRDINIKVIPVTQQFPQAVALSSMAVGGTTGCLSGETVCYGTYTPTVTNGANVAASTPKLSTYQRFGSQACVQGSIDIDPTSAAATATSLTMTLPIASVLASSIDLSGVFIGSNAGTYQAGQISGATATGRAQFDYAAGDTANRDHRFTFCYRIL